MSGILRPRDISAEGVLQAMQIAGDALRLSKATVISLRLPRRSWPKGWREVRTARQQQHDEATALRG